MKTKKGFSLTATIIIIIVTAIVSSIATGLILFNNYNVKSKITYKKLSGDKNLQEFIEAYSSLSKEYYEDIDKGKLIESAIQGMTEYLGDKYTTFMNENEKKMLESSLNGKYTGIGVLVSDNEIKQVFVGSPAEKSGVQVGDKIIRVDGEDVTNLSATEIVNLIRKNDESATIVFLRDDKEIELTIEFKSLDIPSISYKTLDNNVGYIYIGSFSSSLSKQVKGALEKLEEEQIGSLIIDLRDNAGGYLMSASDVASLFLEKGKTIYSLSNNKEKEVYKDQSDEKRTYPIIVLINENSASSAEILAAALKESYGATVVGKTSYGKGKVQQTKHLSDGSMIKYTTALWLTPSGECIDETGIKPDYEIDMSVTYGEDGKITNIEDTQLKKAEELLGQ